MFLFDLLVRTALHNIRVIRGFVVNFSTDEEKAIASSYLDSKFIPYFTGNNKLVVPYHFNHIAKKYEFYRKLNPELYNKLNLDLYQEVEINLNLLGQNIVNKYYYCGLSFLHKGKTSGTPIPIGISFTDDDSVNRKIMNDMLDTLQAVFKEKYKCKDVELFMSKPKLLESSFVFEQSLEAIDLQGNMEIIPWDPFNPFYKNSGTGVLVEIPTWRHNDEKIIVEETYFLFGKKSYSDDWTPVFGGKAESNNFIQDALREYLEETFNHHYIKGFIYDRMSEIEKQRLSYKNNNISIYDIHLLPLLDSDTLYQSKKSMNSSFKNGVLNYNYLTVQTTLSAMPYHTVKAIESNMNALATKALELRSEFLKNLPATITKEKKEYKNGGYNYIETLNDMIQNNEINLTDEQKEDVDNALAISVCTEFSKFVLIKKNEYLDKILLPNDDPNSRKLMFKMNNDSTKELNVPNDNITIQRGIENIKVKRSVIESTLPLLINSEQE